MSDFSYSSSETDYGVKQVVDTLLDNMSVVAFERLRDEARSQHRTTDDVLRQTAYNVLQSFKTRRDTVYNSHSW